MIHFGERYKYHLCGHLDENVPNRLRCSNLVPSFWWCLGRFKVMALPEEMCYWELVWGFQCHTPFHLCSL